MPHRATALLTTEAQDAAGQNHDTDQFRTFDALSKEEQLNRLTKNGPRLPQRYSTSDLSLRAFVQGGWPVALDYGLDSDRPAELTVSVEGAETFKAEIKPTPRNQVRLHLPRSFGAEPKVGKLRIAAFTSKNGPADFRLYGIGMGDRGVANFQATMPTSARWLAMNGLSPRQALKYRPLPSFALRVPQVGSSIEIAANPATINTTLVPKQVFKLTLTSRSDFSNGRWEFWLVRGLTWVNVFSKHTGSISGGKKTNDTWDGMKDQGTVSLGAHALQLTAWHAREEDRAWVVARAEPRLIVVD